jgi:hypothetical protein
MKGEEGGERPQRSFLHILKSFSVSSVVKIDIIGYTKRRSS